MTPLHLPSPSGQKYYLYSTDGPVQRRVFGFSVDSKWATWMELIVVRFVSPHASLLGHVCGIAAGALAVHQPDLVPFEFVWANLFYYGALPLILLHIHALESTGSQQDLVARLARKYCPLG